MFVPVDIVASALR